MPARRSRLVALRRITAGVFIFVGLFVLFFGLGNQQQAVMVAGAATIVLAFSARVANNIRRNPRQWVPSTGHVVDASEPPADARYGRCAMQLEVEVPGFPRESVIVHDSRVPVSHWPTPGDQLPVQVAADDVRRVRVSWRDHVPAAAAVAGSWDQPPVRVAPLPELDDIDFELDGPPTVPMPLIPAVSDPDPGDAGMAEPGPASTPTGAAPTEAVLDEAAPADDGATVEPDASTPAEPDAGAPARPGAVPAETGAPAKADAGTPADAGVPDEVEAAPAEAGATSVPRPRPSPRPRPTPRYPGRPRPPTIPAPAGAAPAGPASDPLPAGGSPPAGARTAHRAGTAVAGAIHRVGVTLLVADLDRSARFYRDQLGFDEVDGGEGTVVLASGATQVMLREAPALGTVSRRMVYLNLEVADVDEVYDELRANGVRFTYPPRVTSRTARHELWAAVLRDPDGHGIAITQWRPRETDT